MKVSFRCFGHQNILATHKTTLEFISGGQLSKAGDCIIGVKTKFPDLTHFLDADKVTVTITVASHRFSTVGAPNKKYVTGDELVIRMGEHSSGRTFLTRADKAAANMPRELVRLMQNPMQEITVEVSDEKTAR